MDEEKGEFDDSSTSGTEDDDDKEEEKTLAQCAQEMRDFFDSVMSRPTLPWRQNQDEEAEEEENENENENENETEASASASGSSQLDVVRRRLGLRRRGGLLGRGGRGGLLGHRGGRGGLLGQKKRLLRFPSLLRDPTATATAGDTDVDLASFFGVGGNPFRPRTRALCRPAPSANDDDDDDTGSGVTPPRPQLNRLRVFHTKLTEDRVRRRREVQRLLQSNPLPDRMICATGFFRSLVSFDPDSLMELNRLRLPGRHVRVVNIPFQSMVAISDCETYGSSIRFVDVKKMKIGKRFTSFHHKGRIWGLDVMVPADMCTSSVRIVSGSAGRGNSFLNDPDASSVVVWRLKSQREWCTLPHAPQRVAVIKIVEEWGPEVFVGGLQTACVYQYDLHMARLIRGCKPERHTSSTATCVRGIAADQKKGLFFTAGTDMKGFAFSRRSGALVEANIQFGRKGTCLDCAEDKHLLIVGTTGGYVELWDTRDLSKRLHIQHPAKGVIYDIKRHSLHTFVLVSIDGTVMLMDQRTGEIVKKDKSSQNEKMVGVCLACSDLSDFAMEFARQEIERIRFMVDFLDGFEAGLCAEIVGWTNTVLWLPRWGLGEEVFL